MKVVAVLLALLAMVPAAEAASTQVTISVPPTQTLEGVTAVALASGGAPPRAQLVVKSNIPWTLVAKVSGQISEAALRVGTGDWTPLGAATPVLRGVRGVHVVTYEVRTRGAAQGVITLSLAPTTQATP